MTYITYAERDDLCSDEKFSSLANWPCSAAILDYNYNKLPKLYPNLEFVMSKGGG